MQEKIPCGWKVFEMSSELRQSLKDKCLKAAADYVPKIEGALDYDGIVSKAQAMYEEILLQVSQRGWDK